MRVSPVLCTDDSTGMGAMVTLMEMFEKSWDEFCVPLSRRIRQAVVREEESEGCEVVDIRGDRDGGAADTLMVSL